jgi:hypothetical protein
LGLINNPPFSHPSRLFCDISNGNLISPGWPRHPLSLFKNKPKKYQYSTAAGDSEPRFSRMRKRDTRHLDGDLPNSSLRTRSVFLVVFSFSSLFP